LYCSTKFKTLAEEPYIFHLKKINPVPEKLTVTSADISVGLVCV